MKNDNTKSLNKVIRIDESEIRSHLDDMVRGTVEETLNALLDAEADAMCNAHRYDRSSDRVDTRAGHYQRKLHTKAGEVEVKMPKLRKQTFETAITERYRRREISIEEAIVHRCIWPVFRYVGSRILLKPCGVRGSPQGRFPNSIRRSTSTSNAGAPRISKVSIPKSTWMALCSSAVGGGEVKNVSVLAAIGVFQDGFRRVLSVAEGHKEDKAGWSAFLAHLKQRGLSGVRLIISDACMGLVESVAEYYPQADWQRCMVGLSPVEGAAALFRSGIVMPA